MTPQHTPLEKLSIAFIVIMLWALVGYKIDQRVTSYEQSKYVEVDGAKWFPFQIDWDGVQGLAGLVPEQEPAGEKGFVQIGADGNFYLQEEPARFFGIQVWPVDDEQKANHLGQRFSSLGFNLWRGHPALACPGTPQALQRLDAYDRFFSIMKEHGLYHHMQIRGSGNLLGMARGNEEFRHFLGLEQRHVPGTGDFPKPGHFVPHDNTQILSYLMEPDLVRAERRWWKFLLNHKNPYTGNAYKNEPAVLCMELLNETYLTHAWEMGKLQPGDLPEYYDQYLDGLWNEYLIDLAKGRLGERATWRGSDGARERLGDGEIGRNQSGKNGEGEGWGLETGREGDLASGRLGETSRKESEDGSRESEAGKKGRFAQGNGEQREGRKGEKLEGNSELEDAGFTKESIQEWLSKRWDEDGKKGLLPGEDPVNGSVARLPARPKPMQLNDYSQARTLDLMRFYNWLQDRYFQESKAYLQQIGCKVPVVGSNWSQLSLPGLETLNGLDVVDSHIYYDMPSPQKKTGWYKNKSIYEVYGLQNLQSILASNSLTGKPFCLSETHWAFPNEYQAQFLPELVSYASLQDWDSLILFYHPNKPLDGIGQTKSAAFMNDFGSNPLILSQAFLASRAFRNHHIQPARKEVVVNYHADKRLETGDGGRETGREGEGAMGRLGEGANEEGDGRGRDLASGRGGESEKETGDGRRIKKETGVRGRETGRGGEGANKEGDGRLESGRGSEGAKGRRDEKGWSFWQDSYLDSLTGRWVTPALPYPYALPDREGVFNLPYETALKHKVSKRFASSNKEQDGGVYWQKNGPLEPLSAEERVRLQRLKDAAAIYSDTGEILSDQKNQILRVEAPAFQSITGQLTQKHSTRQRDFRVAVDRPIYASVSALSLDGQDLHSSQNILVSVVGRVRNSGMQWDEKREHVLKWGQGPVLCEVVPGEVGIAHTKSGQATVWALNGNGRSTHKVRSWTRDGMINFHLDAAQTLWYLVQIEE